MRTLLLAALLSATLSGQSLEQGFTTPPPGARPEVYWLWLNGHVNPQEASKDLRELAAKGFSGVLVFDMGAVGPKQFQPPAGPAFLDKAWLAQLKSSVDEARSLGLAVDLSVVSSWDMGGHWIEPRHATKGLYPAELTVEGGRDVTIDLPFPSAPPAAPKAADGRPAYWKDIALLAIRDARRRPGHELILRLDPDAVHDLAEIVLDNGDARAPAPLAATMSPVRDFSFAVSATGWAEADFREVATGQLPAAAGPRRFPLPPGTRARYVRLRLLSAHDPSRPRWTLGELSVLDSRGANVAAARAADQLKDGTLTMRAPTPLGYDGAWNVDNINDGTSTGPGGVFSTAGPPPLELTSPSDVVDLTARIDAQGRLHWSAPPGRWTLLRYVCMNTGERLKVPSPNSDGWATDHFSAEATRAHMDYVIARLRETFPDLKSSGLRSLYLASYEVRGPVWSPDFAAEFQRRRGYAIEPFLPAVFGARLGTEKQTERFLFDFRKTQSELLIDAYYNAARQAAHDAGLTIKSEAGGPGPPIHNVPVDALAANAAVDEIQGEFWPWWPKVDGLWVVKETAAAAHVYAKGRVHMESFTSFEEWREGPQDIKWSADRVFTEGGNHFVWHTFAHNAPEAGRPGWAYGAGTHLNRNVTWWNQARPFIDYLSRGSFLLQQGAFVADVLYYYGDGGFRFVGPRRLEAPGHDYDVANSDVLLNRVTVQAGRVVVKDGPSYALLVTPREDWPSPQVASRIEQLVRAGATVLGPPPAGETSPQGQRRLGRGRLLWGFSVAAALAQLNVKADFTAPPTLDFIHRTTPEAEIYFVRNTTTRRLTERARFRVNARLPELWDPVTGAIQPAPNYEIGAGSVDVPLNLDKHGSVFVVFRRPAPQGRVSAPARAEREALRLDGPWRVAFESGLGAPPQITMATLSPWSASDVEAIRHFPGTATYSLKFDWPTAPRSPVWLDLGDLWTIGQVRLNGRDLGIVWTAPFRLDCRPALRQGANELEIQVTGTWYNRLAGDARLPPERRLTRTNVTTSGHRPWAELAPVRAGLFGPVRLIEETR